MLGGLLAVGGTARAQSIAGGNSFDAAAPLTAGSFTGGALADETPQYFSITASQGQLITVSTTFNDVVSQYGTISTLALYTQNREEVINKFNTNYSSITLDGSWLVDSSQPTSRFYLMVASDDEGTSSYTMTVTLENKFDAGSTVDSPSGFESNVVLPAGTNVGHLSGSLGNDTADTFIFTPTANGTYQVKLTPATEATMILTVYDAQRQQVDQQYSANAGAITSSTFTADRNSAVYVKVECDANCSSKLADYSIALTTPTNSNTNTAVVNGNVTANTNTVVVNSNTNANANTNGATVNTNTNTTTGTTTDKSDKDDKGLSTTMLLIIGAGVIVILLIVIIIIMARKKKSATPTAPTTPPTPVAPTTPEKK
jgi:hypothetical protein